MTLDKTIIDELREKLLEEKARLSEELSRIGKRVGSTDDYITSIGNIGTGEDENASEVEEYADNLALENTLEGQLREINEALEKIDRGIYGKCENCDKDIDIERLRAYPAAKTCIECK